MPGLFFFNAYLNIADAGIDSYLNKEKREEYEKYIFVSVIYNVKHALELILKALTKFGTPLEIQKTHDVHTLFKCIKNGKDPEVSKILDELEGIIWIYYRLTILPYFYNQKDYPSISFEDKANTFFKYPELDLENGKDNKELSVFVDFDRLIKDVDDVTFKRIKVDINNIRGVCIKILNKIAPQE